MLSVRWRQIPIVLLSCIAVLLLTNIFKALTKGFRSRRGSTKIFVNNGPYNKLERNYSDPLPRSDWASVLIDEASSMRERMNVPNNFFQEILLHSLGDETYFRNSARKTIRGIEHSAQPSESDNSTFGSRRHLATKPDLLCATFTYLSEKTIPEILSKVFAFNTKEKANTDPLSRKYCDWYITIYGGDMRLLRLLKEKIFEIENDAELSHYYDNKNYEENPGISLNRYKGRVVQIIYPSRKLLRKKAVEEKQKYFENAEKIEKKSFLKFDNSSKSGRYGERNKFGTKEVYNNQVITKLQLLLPMMDRSRKEFNIRSYTDLWLMDSDLSLENFDLSAHFRVRKSAIFSNPLPPLSLLSRITSYFFPSNNVNNSLSAKTVTHNNGSSPFYENTKDHLGPILTQPLIYESTQSYKYFNYNSWKEGTLYEYFTGNKQKKTVKKIKKNTPKTKIKNKKTKKKMKKTNQRVIAAETKFVEIQTPIIQMDFFIWFFDFFIVPLLDYSEILGTDWGVDYMFCEAARFYRSEELRYKNSILDGMENTIKIHDYSNTDHDNEYINNEYNNDNNNKTNEMEYQNNNYNNNNNNVTYLRYNNNNNNNDDDINNEKNNERWNNDDVVCAVVTSGTPVHHRNERFLEHELGRHNKAILGSALIEIVSESFPLFYINGHKDLSNPLKSGTTLKTAYGSEPLL